MEDTNDQSNNSENTVAFSAKRIMRVQEMTFPCTETQLSTWLDELRMNPEHLCPAATITQIEPAELSVLEECEVSLDALNYLAKRMDGMSALCPFGAKRSQSEPIL